MAAKVLIYGGTGGIGSALARRISARGGSVHLVARDADRLKDFAGSLGATFTAGDILDPALFERVAADTGGAPLTGLAYAVGTINLKPLHRLTDEDFATDFAINALGAARAVRAALPQLSGGEEPASVVLFSTIAARRGFANHASIAMAKGAVEGLVLSLAAELAPKVRVNAVAPSLTETPLAKAMTANDAMVKAIAGLHAIPRLGRPDDIAAVADLLLSPDAGWITGQVIGVDGGRSTLRTKG